MKRLKPLLFSLLLIAVLGCASDPETYIAEVIDGVRHVNNLAPKWGADPEVGIELIREYGGMDEVDENYLLYKPFSATIDKDGNVYILDAGNFRVQKYDRNGKYILSFGGEGQGPGEYKDPERIGIIFGKFIYIGDTDNNKVEIFDLEGNFIDGIRFNSVVGQSLITETGVIITHYQMESRDKPADRVMTDGTVNRDTGKITRYEEDSDKIMIPLGNYPFMASDKNGNFFFNAWHDNWIRKFTSEGDLLLEISRDLPQKPGMNRATENGTNIGWDTMFSWGIGIDHNDRIWSLTINRNKNENESYNEYSMNPEIFDLEIYDRTGVMLGKIRPGNYVSLMFVIQDSLFMTDYRNNIVYHYKIVEN